MGFGTLFIGYFLFLNITYFEYTDLLAGLIMLLGLYKLATVNKMFEVAFFTTLTFSVFGLFELGFAVTNFFVPSFADLPAIAYLDPIRYLIMGAVTVFILLGIRDVSREVDLKSLATKATVRIYLSAALFLCNAFFSLPLPFIRETELKAIAITAFILLLSLFIIVIMNLVTIYTAYMKICMPEDRAGGEVKKSRFGFINKFREHEEEKQREYAEYRLSKLNKKKKKRKK